MIYNTYMGECNVFYDENGWSACQSCGAYVDDVEPNDTDTESEREEAYSQEYLASFGDIDGATYDDLKADYFLARARFRRKAQRGTRRSRQPRFHAGGPRKGKGKGRDPCKGVEEGKREPCKQKFKECNSIKKRRDRFTCRKGATKAFGKKSGKKKEETRKEEVEDGETEEEPEIIV